ncbi:hypothetical protein PG1C_03085 [Rugosibacter aromaticivorans]|uniref:Uncharacterized protein n=1 Tax=Rugosibacter aromaticivorans TaxID=1565605 RepID=A0A0C5J7V4_9PROT|nr:DUF1178 family protein [Rugosibacter aromaticivorans]AJP47719.1 hypothetical protein PG1C_03085 [Rugosibacter aromaticivorans]TBR12851.1 MAG: DUF1178 family protein [Rugosibacter sp.]
MIVLNLLCDNGHRFEGWFASSEAFRDQQARQLVQCTYCQTTAITQLPSGPHIRRGVAATTPDRDTTDTADTAAAPAAQPLPAMQPEAAQNLFQALAVMARQAENVGDRLPEEARRIHYKEAPARNIRGVATPEETHALLDEGILVLPAPVPPESETH